MPSAIVIAIDGLGASSLGPYGNTWLETPAFNHLATKSILAEQMFAPTASALESYGLMWHGRTAEERPSSDATDAGSLIGGLNQRGISTRLLTDDPHVLDLRGAALFAEQNELPMTPVEVCAEEWERTHLARFFAAGVPLIEDLGDDALLWIHSHGLGNPWDAPLDFRERFAAEADPDVFASTVPPHHVLEENFDPDLLHAIRCAFAGQITLLDHCLEIVHGLIQTLPTADKTLLVVLGTRGYPMGEHRHVGWSALPLYRELLHVPLLVCYPDGRQALQRLEGLGELPDVSLLLDKWFRDPGSAMLSTPDRTFSICRRDTEVLLRTDYWSCRFPQLTGCMEQDLSAAELYVKPDDLTDVNDVSGRCADVAEAAWRFANDYLHSVMTRQSYRKCYGNHWADDGKLY